MDLIRQELVLKKLKKFKKTEFTKNLENLKILIVGCGGVGSVISELIVRGGFKNLILIDSDVIDKTNLQRQLFLKKDIGKFKVDCVKKRLLEINPKVIIENICDNFNEKNLLKEKEFDIIIDATDNVETRKLINEVAKIRKIPWIYNGALKTECMSCLFSDYDLFEKFFRNFKTQNGCEIGVLASTTFVSASICYNLLLQYLIENKKNELIKIQLFDYTITKIKLN